MGGAKMISKTAYVRVLLLVGVGLLAGACKSWVDLSPEAEQIRVSAAAAVESCERIGRTKTRTSEKAWIFPRREERVHDELSRLAQADAAEMGGTDVVPVGDVVDGRREFTIYRCPGGDGEG